jgi:hypothetical protein
VQRAVETGCRGYEGSPRAVVPSEEEGSKIKKYLEILAVDEKKTHENIS